jgi:UDP-N-acetylmuramoyl-L-alanyl-D-glutamate--2,6-diaminopimelate ligase
MNAMLPTNSISLESLLSVHVRPGAKMTSDTRALEAGDVMLAYPVGNSRQLTDNRVHITQALSLGAALVLYEPSGLTEELKTVCKDSRCVAVPRLAEQAGEIAANWHGQPSRLMRVVGITGTNGKTTVSQWLSQTLHSADQPSGVIGTLGAGIVNDLTMTGFTTPDAARLQALLKEIQNRGAHSVAVEVSSHALDQGRVNGTYFDTVVITNLSQDHLDYHGDMKEYAAAKKKILDLPEVKHVVVNADDWFGQECLQYLAKKMGDTNITVWAYAAKSENLLSLPCFAKKAIKKVLATDLQMNDQGMKFQLIIDGEDAGLIQSRIVGTFNVSNALAVFACLLAGGKTVQYAKNSIEQLQAVQGRMELVPRSTAQQPMAVIDFAHTPDALEQVLKTLQVIAKQRGGQLWCVFGCGGDRDALKRPIMGRIAESIADHVMVTSDNPRSEVPEKIMADILSGFDVPEKAQTNADRATAILQTIRQAKPEDVVLIAGKGHEETQEIAGKKQPFSDRVHVQLAMGGVAG